ncbi:Pseudouridine kinase [Roseibium album]|uniref:Pseudouridine kinase n=1 Tax=Roseibium album TaxID=311410 RepID=A0A0M6Z992_9HYPH|nr:Pseudouridine kinase [Roseibium album]CTQ64804.1 Pseudouridine kinase [Roseibium album]CTQ74720.1 Pseudouridine kinase [Roseibium album]
METYRDSVFRQNRVTRRTGCRSLDDLLARRFSRSRSKDRPALDGSAIPVFSTPEYRLVSIGAVHYDTIAHAVTKIHRETSTPARFSARPGGVATNIARAVSQLGVETTLIGAVGGDGAAHLLEDQLTREGLRLNLVQRLDHSTGQYLAFHDPGGELAAACVDDRVLSEAPDNLFDTLLDKETKVSNEKTLWFLDANLPEAMLQHTIERIGGQFVIANAVSDAKAPRLRPVLKGLDCLTLNKSEAASLLNRPTETPAEALAQALIDSGLKSFILTDGGGELRVFSGETLRSFAPHTAEIVDVTGAGDALTAGMIAALARGYDLLDATRFGLSAAALTLRSTGALAGDLSWQNLEIFDQSDKL